MVALGEGVGKAFKDMYNVWKQGNIMEGFKLVLGDMQLVKEQIITKFAPLANHILNGVRKATTFVGKVINRLNGFLGGDNFEGESSSFDLIMPAQVRENLQAAGFRYISVTQHCQRAFVKSVKRSQLLNLNGNGLLRLSTARCDYIQNVNNVDITIYRENNPNGGVECQNGIAIQGEDRKVRLAPIFLQLVGWRPVVHWTHTVDSCKNVVIPPRPASPLPPGVRKEDIVAGRYPWRTSRPPNSITDE
ncbi:hypothetical protein BKA69DRAFT_304272 [Paraphysoderma sedebokerense]|nr:hypothetical protein BKA69DRAFT_304272 [Paraphysoderma sedebokerense]